MRLAVYAASVTETGTQTGYSIGIDLGGTNLRIAAYSRDSVKLESISIRTRLESGPRVILQDMADAVRNIEGRCGSYGQFGGVGVGSPGPIELPEGRLMAPANLPGWHNLALKAELENMLDMPVIVESDANAAALAEWHLGSGRFYGVDSMAMLTLGTGVGGGLVLNGKIWHGSMGMADEPGHSVIHLNGLPCNCGSKGCLEVYASATAVCRMATEASTGPGGEALQEHLRTHGVIHAHDVAISARDGDRVSLKIFEQAGTALGLSLAATVSALNLPLHAIGGGLAQAWDLFAPAMLRSLYETSQVYRLTQPANPEVFEARKTNILPAKLGPEAGIIGAALLPYFQ